MYEIIDNIYGCEGSTCVKSNGRILGWVLLTTNYKYVWSLSKNTENEIAVKSTKFDNSNACLAELIKTCDTLSVTGYYKEKRR